VDDHLTFRGCLSFFPKPEICMTRNKNIFLYEKSVNFIQIKKEKKYFLKLEGHIITFLHFLDHDIVSIIFGAFFISQKTPHPLKV
jgi:hypothetical protein